MKLNNSHLVWAFVSLTVLTNSNVLAGEDKSCPAAGGPLSEAEIKELSVIDQAAYKACQALPTKDTSEEYVRHFQSRIGAYKGELQLLYTKLNTKEIKDELARNTTNIPDPNAIGLFVAKALAKSMPLAEVALEGALMAGDFLTAEDSRNDGEPEKSVEKIIRKYIDRLEALELNMNSTQTRRAILCQFAPPAPKLAKDKKKDEYNKICEGLEKVRGSLDCRNLMHIGNSDKLVSDKRKFASSVAQNIAQNVQVNDREIGKQTTGMLQVTVKLKSINSDGGYSTNGQSWDFTGFGSKDLLCQVLQNPKFRKANGDLKETTTLDELQLPVRVKFITEGRSNKTYLTYGQQYGKMTSHKEAYTLGSVDSYRDHAPGRGPYTDGVYDDFKNMEAAMAKGHKGRVLNHIPIKKIAGDCPLN